MNTRSPQLDGLRGIAVSLVVVHHWTSWGPSLGLGNIGVQLFYVLSGFLITRILLSAKDRCAAGASDLKGALMSFHVSRVARIWPVFYLTIALVFIAGDHFEHRADLGWHALFGSNLLFFHRGEFGSALAHFWSLAVEQQFYLLWPLVVLAVPLNCIEVVILGLIGVAPLMRMALYVDGFTAFAQYNVLPFANFDSLGCGALTALWSRSPKAVVSSRWQALRMLAAVATVTLIGSYFLRRCPEIPNRPFWPSCSHGSSRGHGWDSTVRWGGCWNGDPSSRSASSAMAFTFTICSRRASSGPL